MQNFSFDENSVSIRDKKLIEEMNEKLYNEYWEKLEKYIFSLGYIAGMGVVYRENKELIYKYWIKEIDNNFTIMIKNNKNEIIYQFETNNQYFTYTNCIIEIEKLLVYENFISNNAVIEKEIFWE